MIYYQPQVVQEYQRALPPHYETVLSKLASNPVLMTLLGALIGQYKMDRHPVKGGMAGLATSLFWNIIKKKQESQPEQVPPQPVIYNPQAQMPVSIFPQPPQHRRYGR